LESGCEGRPLKFGIYDLEYQGLMVAIFFVCMVMATAQAVVEVMGCKYQCYSYYQQGYFDGMVPFFTYQKRKACGKNKNGIQPVMMLSIAMRKGNNPNYKCKAYHSILKHFIGNDIDAQKG